MTTIGTLKIKLKTFWFTAREIRKRENHLQKRADWLSQKQSFKHKKDEPKPGPKNYPSLEEIEKKLQRKVDEVLDEVAAEYWNLRTQRTVELRKMARISHLAYCFLRGTPYKDCEKTSYSFPNLKEVEEVALDFSTNVGDNVFKSQWNAWASQAKEHYEKEGNLNPKKTELVAVPA